MGEVGYRKHAYPRNDHLGGDREAFAIWLLQWCWKDLNAKGSPPILGWFERTDALKSPTFHDRDMRGRYLPHERRIEVDVNLFGGDLVQTIAHEALHAAKRHQGNSAENEAEANAYAASVVKRFAIPKRRGVEVYTPAAPWADTPEAKGPQKAAGGMAYLFDGRAVYWNVGLTSSPRWERVAEL